MEENFDPVARTRANYYTPGSPVQFVCVELLKGESSGEHAVCLTFKNISKPWRSISSARAWTASSSARTSLSIVTLP